jgi:hypothetical protein
LTAFGTGEPARSSTESIRLVSGTGNPIFNGRGKTYHALLIWIGSKFCLTAINMYCRYQ